jgi:hypothetical protein
MGELFFGANCDNLRNANVALIASSTIVARERNGSRFAISASFVILGTRLCANVRAGSAQLNIGCAPTKSQQPA